ncbi:hypothetical protein Tco_0995685, partial [Tanacetum coccineum]
QESREVPHLSPRDGSVAGSEHSLESSDSSSESNDDDDDDDDEGGVENREGLEVGNDDEDKESKHIDKLDEIQSAIKWTEYDQKNLMNLGTSEMERNRRLENLIARRRARKTMRMQAENNLIDLESTDLPWNIPPISTARNNPFDYDSNDNIPGSAPSVFMQRRNPFDLPYDSSEEKPDLVGDTFHQEFAVAQPKEPFFRRHESFNVGPSGFGAARSERQESRLKPYFVPERSFADFQRQFSGLSDSKASSVPDTESVSSVGDLENKDQIDDEQSLIVELGSEKDHDHDSESEREHVSDHVRRPYFVPEQVVSDETGFSTFQRRLSEVSDSKVSSVPDTDSDSSDDDLEHKDHIEDEHSLEAEVAYEKDDEHESEIREHLEITSEDEQPVYQSEHVSDHATHGSDTIEDDSIADLIQVPRGDVAELIVGNATNEQEVANAEPSMDLMSDEIHMNLGDQELHGNVSSSSSLCEVSDQIYNDNEGDDEVDASVAEPTYYFVDRVDTMERSEVGVTSLLVEESHPREPVYDSSPRSVSRNLSSSSILNDLQAEIPVGEDHPHRDESVQHTEDQHHPTSSVADSSPETMDAQNQLPAVLDYKESLIDMDASHELEHVQVSTSNSHERSSEGVHQEEVVSHSEEVESLFGGSLDKPLMTDSQELQGHEFEEVQVASSNSEAQFNEVIHIETHETASEEEAISQAQKEFPLLDTSVNEPSEENLEVLQEQITDSNTENFQIQETENDVSLNMNSVSSAEPDAVQVGDIEPKTPGSPAHATDTHSIDANNVPDEVDDLDEIQDIDETLLVELDAVGDFSVNDLGSSSNDMKEDPCALEYDFETNRIADEGSYSNDLGSVSNETKPDPHASEHDLETTHSVDEDSYSKEVGSTLYEETRGLEHDIETKSSGEQESDSKGLDSTLDEVKQDPTGSDHDLETQHSGNDDSYSKDLNSTLNEIKQDPQAFDHDLETERPGDEDFYSKDLVSTLDERKQDPHTSEYDLETKRSIDEDSYTKDLESTFSEMRRDPQALEHRLETFYSVDDSFYSKHVESTLNEMNQDKHALEHDIKTNSSSEAEVKSQNEKETSNTEVEDASDAEASKRELINDANEALLPLETESSTPLAGSGSATVANHGTEKATSTSDTDKE